MRPLYIFDLDGTLSLIDHRRHYVTGPDKDWAAFNASCVNDLPNEPVIRTLDALMISKCDILIFSGRSDAVREQTIRWLKDNIIFVDVRKWEDMVLMRKDGDYTPDEVLKRSWYEAMPEHDKKRLVAVFDDRDKVVKMWRDLGVTCFQVAYGDF